MNKTEKFHGIIPPLVTPLLDNNKLDYEGLERLLEHVITGGVHGVFILGTTGEAQSLSYTMRTEMIRQTSILLKGRLPLLVGISDTSLTDSLALSQKAYEYGADAVVSAPPYYFAPGQPELAEFYEKLIPQLELPLFLYNMPAFTKVSFSIDTIKRLAEQPGVIGLKDSSANGTYLQSVLYAMRDRSDFSVFVGPEEMMAEAVMMGASGGVNGGANLFPRLYVDLYNAAKANRIDEVKQLQQKVMKISTSIYNNGNYGSSYLKGLKCALSILNICDDFVASPFNRFDYFRRNEISKALDEINLSLTCV